MGVVLRGSVVVVLRGSVVVVSRCSVVVVLRGSVPVVLKGSVVVVSRCSVVVVSRGSVVVVSRGSVGVVLRGSVGVVLRGSVGVVLRGSVGVVLRGSMGVFSLESGKSKKRQLVYITNTLNTYIKHKHTNIITFGVLSHLIVRHNTQSAHNACNLQLNGIHILSYMTTCTCIPVSRSNSLLMSLPNSFIIA